MPVISVVRRLGRIAFKSSLGYKSRPCLIKNKTPNISPIKITEIATSSKAGGQGQFRMSIYPGVTYYSLLSILIFFLTLKGDM